MTIAIVTGAWGMGSLLLGLLLGRLFRTFAARRHAEEKLFASLERMYALKALGGKTNLRGSKAIRRTPGAADSPTPLEPGQRDRVSPWAAHQRGRVIQ
jgi:hypothetical protein